MKTKRKIVNTETDLKSLFMYFLTFTKPMHKLRPQEIDLLTEILYLNQKEKPNFKREEDRWKKVFSYESKLSYRENLNMADHTLQNLFSSLRKKGVINNNKVTSYYIPSLDLDTDQFQLVFNFKISEREDN